MTHAMFDASPALKIAGVSPALLEDSYIPLYKKLQGYIGIVLRSKREQYSSFKGC